MSTMILYFLDFESPLFADYQNQIIKKVGDINDIFTNTSQINIKNKKNNNENNNLDIKNEFNYENY
jgi:hypothetical protein